MCVSLTLRKNYESRSTTENTEENSSDLIPHGQTEISFFKESEKAPKNVTAGEKRTEDVPGQNQSDHKVPNKLLKPSAAAEKMDTGRKK